MNTRLPRALGLAGVAILLFGFAVFQLAAPASAATDSVTNVNLTMSSLVPNATEVSYSISFTAPDGLNTGYSTITVAAPAGTKFVGGGYVCGTYYVYDENSGAGENCETPTTSNSGATVSILSNGPNVRPGDQVTVLIYGVTNDSTTSAQTLKVSTSSDTTAVSVPYTLSSAGQIGPPNYNQSSYTASASGVTDTATFVATDGLTEGFSTITLAGPTGTQFVAGGYMCATYVLVDITTDVSNNCMTATSSNSGATVTLVPNAPNVNPGDVVTLFAHSVTNAPAPGTLDISTSSDPTPQAVSTAAATAGPVSLQLSSYAPTATATYSANFTTSHGLAAASSTITVTAPSGTVFPENTSCTYAVWDETTGSTACSSVTGTGSDSVTITVPLTVSAGAQVGIVIAAATNDSSVATQSLSISDSADGAVGSASYTLSSSGAISALEFVSNTLEKSAKEATYASTFVSTDALDAGSGYEASSISLEAPTGTSFPSAVTDYLIWDDNSGVEAGPVGVVLSNGGATATVYTNLYVPRGHEVTLLVDGVTNDSVTTAQTFKTLTTADPIAQAAGFTLSSKGEVTGGTLGLTSHVKSARGVRYTVTFNATDGLTEGLSTVKLAASTGTVFDGGSGGTLCGVFTFYDDTTESSATCETVTPSSADATVTITVPMRVVAGDEVTIVSNGVTNTSAATGSLAISTSSDTKAESVAYTLH